MNLEYTNNYWAGYLKRKLFNYSSAWDLINTLWYIYTIEYYTLIKGSQLWSTWQCR